MDRRTYLAFALMILVLVVYSAVFGPKKRSRPTPPTATDSTEVVASPPVIEAAKTSAPGAQEPRGPMLQDKEVTDQIPELVHVETDLIQAEFDPIGGTIRSWRLREYTDAAEEEADLVRTRDIGAPWVALKDGSRTIRTDSTRFRCTVHRDGGATAIRFVAQDSLGLVLEKSYRVIPGRYDCEVSIRVEGMGQRSEGGAWEIGWLDGLPMLERNPRLDQMSIASVAQFGKEYVRTGGRGSFGCAGCAGGGVGRKTEEHEGVLRWFGVRSKYFLGALILDEPGDRRVKSWCDGTTHTAGAILSEPLSYTGKTEQAYRLYLGPIHYGILKDQGVGLERVQDLGPGIFRPFSKLIMQFFQAVHHVIPNYGVEILILSVLVRFLFYPLTRKSMQSMRRMQQLKPELDRINEKFKDDPQRRQEEMMKLYKREKVNPAGACLPMLPQLPVLSGLFYVLANAIQLRKEPFVLWIRDLSVPDTVAHVAGFPVNVMPLIMGATMLVQQQLTPTDPRQKTMGYMMPILMIFFFYSMSSGLVLYWTVSNVMSVLQQAWMNREQSSSTARPSKEAPSSPEMEPVDDPDKRAGPRGPRRRKAKKR